MNDRLARYSRGRLHRLKGRSTPDALEEQITLKVPVPTLKVSVSTHREARRRGEFLIAPKLPLQQRDAQELVGSEQESLQELPSEEPGLQEQASLPLSPDLVQWDKISTLLTERVELSELTEETQKVRSVGRVEKVQTLRLAALEQAKSTQFKSHQPLNLGDDPEFEKLATIPMMVLTGISKEQGQKKPVMQSEISGAAGAAGLVGLGSIISVVLKYIAVFLIQYGFGPALYGLFTLSSSLVNLAASIFNLGLDDAMVRYTAIYRSKQSASSLRGLMIFCTALAGIAGLIGALLLLFFTPSLAALWVSFKHHKTVSTIGAFSQVVPLLQIMAPMIPLICMQMVWFGGLRGFKAFKWRTLSMSILQPLLQIILLLLILRFLRNISSVAIVMLVSTIFSTTLNLYFLFRQLKPVATTEPEQYESREWLSFASLNFLTTIIDTVLDSIDTILLAAFGVPDVQLGEYGAAIRISSFIAMPLLTLNNIFAPTIAELHSKGERQKLEAMFKVVTKWSTTFSLPIFLIMVLFSPYILALTGAAYEAAWPLVIAFALGAMINALTGSVGYMLLMTGYQRLSFLNSIAAVGTNLVLGIILTPRYGAMGTAISTGLAIVVINIMRLLQVRLLLKMHPYRKDIIKPLGAAILSSALAGGGLYLLTLTHSKLYVTLGHAILSVQLLLIPIFLVSYIGLLILFKGSPEDEIVMKSLRKKLKFLHGKNGKNKKKKKG